MTYAPIARLDVENYGCIREASFRLSPLHALIGPNDSGKSTTLRALRIATQFASGAFITSDTTVPKPSDSMIDPKGDGPSLGIVYGDNLAYRIRNQAGVSEAVYDGDQPIARSNGLRNWEGFGLLATESPLLPVRTLAARLTTATMVRFDPEHLRAPTRLIPESEGIAFLDERGTGLPSVFDAILNRDAEAFAAIQAVVRHHFPSVARLGLINVSSSHKTIGVTLTDGTRVGAQGMSEGLLYFLGFMALRHITGSRLLLVEEPENGLHPARIAEVVAILREISKESQVVLATHSPLVVNELQGDEVTVVTRDAQAGTRAVTLKDVPGYDDAMKVYQPGEFWVSYCDGYQERPLLTGEPRT